jgi:hypothetical protein
VPERPWRYKNTYGISNGWSKNYPQAKRYFTAFEGKEKSPAV